MTEEPSESRGKILLIEDSQQVREELREMLEGRFEVSAVSSAEEAMEVVLHGGPFHVVVCDYDLPGMSGVEFLHEMCVVWPETTRIIVTGVKEFDRAVDSVHRGDIYRFLTKPCTREDLVGAVESALELYESKVGVEIQTRELEFTKSSLEQFTRALEERVDNQTECLGRLHEFAVSLHRARSLEEIAELSIDAVYATMAGRGVHLQIWDRSQHGIEMSRGPEMSSQMHSVFLQTQDGPVGEIVVDFYDPESREITEVERGFLASIASSTAVAAHNEFRRRERDEAQYATIFALARLAEMRDNETGKHLERVSLYCKLIAEELQSGPPYADQIDDRFIRDLVESAPLHDIGKVGIPDSILLKPGSLGPGEWEIMKTHAEIGAATMQSVIDENTGQTFLTMGRDIALCHHEKWDGSGYPVGLSGHDIPLAARILALADVYDALTTVRPYKKAWPHARAMSWIKGERGKHFDPVLVDAFTKHWSTVDQIRSSLADVVSDFDKKPHQVAASA